MGFHAVILVKTFQLMYHLLLYETVRLMLNETKVILALHHNSKLCLRLFCNENQIIFGLPSCRTRDIDNLSSNVSITIVRLILSKLE